MQGYPGGDKPGYPQYSGQVAPGYQYPAAGYGAQPAAGYGQPAMPAVTAQQQPHPPVRPEDVNFQLPPDGKLAVSFNIVFCFYFFLVFSFLGRVLD